MKSTGIVRKVDELGRIVIPIELRRTLGVDERDPMEIYVNEETIVLKKFESSCVFCGKTKELTRFRNKNICDMCLNELKLL